MRRTNTFAVRPRSEEDERLLRKLLDASASLWNALNYERRQNLFADEERTNRSTQKGNLASVGTV